jgi:hypothetical protein
MIEVFTRDATVLAALVTASANDPLYQKARAVRAIAIAARAAADATDSGSTTAATAAAAATAATAAVKRAVVSAELQPEGAAERDDHSSDRTLQQQQVPVIESIYASMAPSDFNEVLYG